MRHILRHIAGKVLVIWDGLPAHRSRKVKAFLSETKGRVHLEQLPGYAPDLNPKESHLSKYEVFNEGIWQHLKNVELAGVCCEHLEALKKQLRLAVERLRHKTNVIIGCFGLAGLDI